MAKTKQTKAEIELERAATRQATVDLLRGAQSGTAHLAKREHWDNARTAGVFSRLVMAARALTSANKAGARKALDQGGAELAAIRNAVYEKDIALSKAAKARANTAPAEPTSSEVAEQAQSDDPPVNPAAMAAAQALFAEQSGAPN